jgi:hypothetical protein
MSSAMLRRTLVPGRVDSVVLRIELNRAWCAALILANSLLGAVASAEGLIFADGKAFPGELWRSTSGVREERVHRREATANRAYPHAAMKLGHIAVGPDDKVYFASGLDGYVLHLLDGRNEILSFEFPGQIRDLDSGNEEHTVYFSVVPTPQNGEQLADGKIYRRDLWAGAPTEVATVRQAEIGGNWWGTFAIVEGMPYIATLDNPSRLFKLTSAGPEPVFTANRAKIIGLASSPDGKFLFTDGSNKVFRTSDFETVETVHDGGRPFTDVAPQ